LRQYLGYTNLFSFLFQTLLEDQNATIKDLRSKVSMLEGELNMMERKYRRSVEELEAGLEEDARYRSNLEDKVEAQEENISQLGLYGFVRAECIGSSEK
jgi:hypothetical protein